MHLRSVTRGRHVTADYNTRMVDCPNCGDAMTPKVQEEVAAVAHAVEVGCCAACNLLWFDRFSSIQLSPKSVLELFRYIGAAGKAQRTLASGFRCPRCRGSLALTRDLQRTTHFSYWRCPVDHGQLITFNQFLAQKNFIREPSPQELARLRATVREISCSQCGASIELAKDSACPHCGAPVALIDPDGVAKALRELASGTAFASVNHDRAQALSDAQIDALFGAARQHDGEQDLLAIGAAALGSLVGVWLASD